MAHKVLPMPLHSDFYKELFDCARKLDEAEWALEQHEQQPSGQNVIGSALNQVSLISSYVSTLADAKLNNTLFLTPEDTTSIHHVTKKIERLNKRLKLLQTSQPHQAPQHAPQIPIGKINLPDFSKPPEQNFKFVPPIHYSSSFIPPSSSTNPYSTNSNFQSQSHVSPQNNSNHPLRPAINKPLSYTIEEAQKNNTPQIPKLTSFEWIDRLAYLLRNGKEQQALSEFATLPPSFQGTVYEALWFVRGRPKDTNPIAHSNFGEVSFKNIEQRCYSTPQQKACAVEFAKIPAALNAIIDAFNKNDTQTAYEIFNDLPSQIKNELYGKHWHTMGRPSDQSSDESLRKISHPDFGKVSLLGLEPRCDVSANKKADTFRAYLQDYRKKMNPIQDTIEQTLSEWPSIDSSAMRGQQKNETKIKTLDAFAQKIVPQFLDLKSINKPNPKGQSYQSLAEAYAIAFPCLRPFLFQLIPSLTISNDSLIEKPSDKDSPKSSASIPLDLTKLSDPDRKQYRKNIMDETLNSLQEGYYINSKGQKVVLHLAPAVQSLCMFKNANGTFKRQGPYSTQIFLENKDCLTVTRDCSTRGLSPIVLDAASDKDFGGGYRTGAGAQEENICRRTGLCIAVDTKLKTQDRNFYPLSNGGHAAGLYVSNVPVFRGEEENSYPYLDQPFETAVGIIAAHNFNENHQKKLGVPDSEIKKLVIENGGFRLPPKEANETKEKLATFLQMASDNHHDSVVLIPLGCGAFRNPPKHFCELALQVITEQFPNSFKEIHFSVIDDHNTGKRHNPDGNYTPIKDTILQYANTLSAIGAKITMA